MCQFEEYSCAGAVILGLGANLCGRWGPPSKTFDQALAVLNSYGIMIRRRSEHYKSAPLGGLTQPEYLNIVVSCDTSLPPQSLLNVLKHVERLAGRRAGLRWGARVLDIDIIDYKGQKTCWPGGPVFRPSCAAKTAPKPWRKDPRHLILPHQDAHLRDFVMVPLSKIQPRWHHPVFGHTAKVLAAHLTRIIHAE